MSLSIGHIRVCFMTFPCHDFICLLNCFFLQNFANAISQFPVSQTGEIILHGVFRVVSISRLLTDSLGQALHKCWFVLLNLISRCSASQLPFILTFSPLPSLWFCFHFRNFQQCFKESWSLCWTRWDPTHTEKKSPFFNEAQEQPSGPPLTSCPAPWDTMLT